MNRLTVAYETEHDQSSPPIRQSEIVSPIDRGHAHSGRPGLDHRRATALAELFNSPEANGRAPFAAPSAVIRGYERTTGASFDPRLHRSLTGLSSGLLPSDLARPSDTGLLSLNKNPRPEPGALNHRTPWKEPMINSKVAPSRQNSRIVGEEG